MNKQEAHRYGLREGQGIVRVNYVEFRNMGLDEVLEAVSEIESNARQFSPFEQLAAEFNRSRNPDAMWEAYESGVYAGAKAAWRKIRAAR